MHFVIGQFGGLELELSGIEVPLPAAGILFAEGQVDQSPAAHHRRAHDLFGFGFRVPQALQGDLDVDEWLPDPFLSFLHYPAGVLDGRRLHGADDVVKLVEIELAVLFGVGLDLENLDVLALLVIPTLNGVFVLLSFNLYDQPAVFVGLERYLAICPWQCEFFAQGLGGLNGLLG